MKAKFWIIGIGFVLAGLLAGAIIMYQTTQGRSYVNQLTGLYQPGDFRMSITAAGALPGEFISCELRGRIWQNQVIMESNSTCQSPVPNGIGTFEALNTYGLVLQLPAKYEKGFVTVIGIWEYELYHGPDR